MKSKPTPPTPIDMTPEGAVMRAHIDRIKNRTGEIESLRPEFEEWITASPYERDIDRWPDDESKHAWPGQYKDINVSLAWEAWQESALIHSLPSVQAQAAHPKSKQP